MSDSEIIFELNNDLIDLDASNFAKKTVEDWLAIHGEIVENRKIIILKNGLIFDFLNEYNCDNSKNNPTQ